MIEQDICTSLDGKINYIIGLYNISNDNPKIIDQYLENEWYIETGKFDSKNIYCKGVVDAKITALETENAILKAQIELMNYNWWKNFYPGFSLCVNQDLINSYNYTYYSLEGNKIKIIIR